MDKEEEDDDEMDIEPDVDTVEYRPDELVGLLYKDLYTFKDDTEELSLHHHIVSTYSRFSISYSTRVFKGWVKQPSPSCAAAVMAGVNNSLCNEEDNEPRIYMKDVLTTYINMINNRISSRKNALLRTIDLTTKDLELLHSALVTEFHSIGRSFGGKKTSGIQKKIFFQVLDTLLEKVSSSDDDACNFYYNELIFTRLRELLKSSGDNVVVVEKSDDDSSTTEVADNDSNTTPSSTEADIPPSTTEQKEDTEKSEDSLKEESAEEKNDNEEPLVKPWKVKKQRDDVRAKLYDYFHHIDGLAKLQRPDKPSTSIIGNWALKSVFKEKFDAKVVLSKSSLRKMMKSKDSIFKEWSVLRTAFDNPDNVLVYHLKNHYALIYATRSYYLDDTMQYEILTAERGQRPSVWLSFTSYVIPNILSWEGYQILAFSKKTDNFNDC